MSELNILFF